MTVPPFTKQKEERECLGGGWLGSVETVTKEYNMYFIVMEDSLPIGVLNYPYNSQTIKSDIFPLDYKLLYKEVKDFIESLKI